MANQLTNELLAQIFGQQSDDPFLTLVTISHASFADDIRLVNNTENIISRGQVFQAFPMRIRFPADDGETMREFNIDLDNVALDLIASIRTVTTQMDVLIELVLASMPDVVQLPVSDLKINSVSYNSTIITAKLVLDNFLNTELTGEKYNPTNFPGIF